MGVLGKRSLLRKEGPPHPGLVYDRLRHRWVRPEGLPRFFSPRDRKQLVDMATRSRDMEGKKKTNYLDKFIRWMQKQQQK